MQELHGLFAEIEDRLQKGDYDINHLSDFENDLKKVIDKFTSKKQSIVGPNKADALLELLLTKVPEVWESMLENETNQSAKKDKTEEKKVKKQEEKLKKKK